MSSVKEPGARWEAGERLPRGLSPHAVATKDFAGVDNHSSCNAERFRIFPHPSKHAALHNGLQRTGRLGFAPSLGDLSPITFHFSPASPPDSSLRRTPPLTALTRSVTTAESWQSLRRIPAGDVLLEMLDRRGLRRNQPFERVANR